MKCVFATDGLNPTINIMLGAALKSLKMNTELEPIIICGVPDVNTPPPACLNGLQVKVIPHVLSFQKEIEHFSFDKIDQTTSLGSMYESCPEYFNMRYIITDSLRIDIPEIFPNDDYILYADCDTIFLKEPTFEKFTEPLGVARRMECDGFFNTGVMYMNLNELRKVNDQFKSFYINSNYKFEKGEVTTQGAYNSFFKDVKRFPISINYHAYWGYIDGVEILHFCGPKPFEYYDILQMIKSRTHAPRFRSHYDKLSIQYTHELYRSGSMVKILGIYNKYAAHNRILVDPQYF